MEKNTIDRKIYDCDTSACWSTLEDYRDIHRKFGHFIEDGRAYEIKDQDTPRPWLNYLCNDKFGSVVSNTGLGFTFYKKVWMRITHYQHRIDYLPRTFEDGREVFIEDLDSGERWNVFREMEIPSCIHRPGKTEIVARGHGLEVKFEIFVCIEDPAECWMLTVRNSCGGQRRLLIRCEQIWSFKYKLIPPIPYTPCRPMDIRKGGNNIVIHTGRRETLPVEFHGIFMSPQAVDSEIRWVEKPFIDGEIRSYPVCSLVSRCDIPASGESRLDVLSGVDEKEEWIDSCLLKYSRHDSFEGELDKVFGYWGELIGLPSCRLPERDIQNFLNVWLKNQLHVTFRFVRGSRIGYRDTLQDLWGYTLFDLLKAKDRLLYTLSHMLYDGSCPRQIDIFEKHHVMKKYMDSAVWIPISLIDYIKETGEFSILSEKIRYLDNDMLETVDEHIRRALDLLYLKRGAHEMCLVGEGDWNDAIEGLSEDGDAESVWLTIALFHAFNLMGEIYLASGDGVSAAEMNRKSEVIKDAVNRNAWDGEWYLYGFMADGREIGSRKNEEGKIHLNSQAWAIFTGLADGNRVEIIRRAVHEYLDTPLGPVLMMPPYTMEGARVGRINRLEPGTYENASVYQHAVTFKIYADIKSGHYDEAVRTFLQILPTNPGNPDSRRAGEPYCTGNYYCGPSHERFGQNFFSWFTGNPAWLLRIGFDEICGVKADFMGLRIEPKVPASWNRHSVRREFRGSIYEVYFERVSSSGECGIWVGDSKIDGNLIVPSDKGIIEARVLFK